MKVYIIGGGVAGMSVAHELGKHNMQERKRFDITILEKDPRYVGGKARSIYHKEGEFGVAGKWDYLPAEHGFRFFPGFYGNMDKTMQEIPANEGKTVLDNLVRTSTYMFSFAHWRDENDDVITRQPVELPTIVEPWDFIGSCFKILKAAGKAKIDVSSRGKIEFSKSLLRMMTSCEMRISEEYERIPWSKFIDADNPENGADYKRFFADGITRSLAAAKSNKTSSRTGSLVFPKMFKECVFPYGKAGRILNAPTNEAWLNHWYRHITEDKKVEYLKDWKCEAILSDFDDKSNKVIVSGVRMVNSAGDEWEINDKNAYYVFALPVEVMAELLQHNKKRSHYKLIDSDPMLSQVINMGDSVDWMVGIIFYLRKELEVTHGHINLIDSAWAITGIQQEQFWENAYKEHTFADGNIKGILSMIMSNCDQDSDIRDKRAVFEMTRKDIILEAWRQMKQSTFVRDKNTPNAPFRNLTDDDIYMEYTYLDDAVTDLPIEDAVQNINDFFSEARRVAPNTYPSSTHRFELHEFEKAYEAYKIARHADHRLNNIARVNICRNDMCLLVNQINTFGLRPSAYTRIDNLFLAGDYVRTGVDLATMEGANESGKRAANAILMSLKKPLSTAQNAEIRNLPLTKVSQYRSPASRLYFQPLMICYYLLLLSGILMTTFRIVEVLEELQRDDKSLIFSNFFQAYIDEYWKIDWSINDIQSTARFFSLLVLGGMYIMHIRTSPPRKSWLIMSALVFSQVVVLVLIPEIFVFFVLAYGIAYFGLKVLILAKKRDDEKDYMAGLPWNLVPSNRWMLNTLSWVLGYIFKLKATSR